MVTQDSFYGGGEHATISGTRTLAPGMKRVQVITPTGAGLNCNLVNARAFKLGGPIFYVINLGADSIGIRNLASTVLATLTTNQVAEIHLLDQAASTGVWVVKVSNVGFSSGAAFTKYHYFSGADYRTAQFATDPDRTVEYNQVLDLYTQKTDSTLAGENGASFTFGATLHQTGGSSSATGHRQYDPDVWSTETAVPVGHEEHSGCELATNTGAIFGGSTSGGTGTLASRVRTYTFTSGAWTSRTTRPSVNGTYRNPAVSINSEALVLGSQNGLETHVYSIDTWVAKTARSLPANESQAGFATADNGYLFAGSSGDISGRSVLGLCYNKASDVWTSVVSMPEGRARPAGSYIDPYGMIFGGNTASDFQRGYAYRYDPATDSLTKMTDINFWGWTEGQCHAQGILA